MESQSLLPRFLPQDDEGSGGSVAPEEDEATSSKGLDPSCVTLLCVTVWPFLTPMCYVHKPSSSPRQALIRSGCWKDRKQLPGLSISFMPKGSLLGCCHGFHSYHMSNSIFFQFLLALFQNTCHCSATVIQLSAGLALFFFGVFEASRHQTPKKKVSRREKETRWRDVTRCDDATINSLLWYWNPRLVCATSTCTHSRQCWLTSSYPISYYPTLLHLSHSHPLNILAQ